MLLIALNTVSRVKAFSLLWGVKTGYVVPVYGTVHMERGMRECTAVHSASVLSQRAGNQQRDTVGLRSGLHMS